MEKNLIAFERDLHTSIKIKIKFTLYTHYTMKIKRLELRLITHAPLLSSTPQHALTSNHCVATCKYLRTKKELQQ